jgi:inhibitor of cysteine peptidase
VPSVSYGAKDAGRTVTLAVGTRFIVELEENATTGYTWSSPEFDEKIVALTGDEPTRVGSAIGAGGTRKFEFATRAPGKTTIRLGLRQPWMPNAAPEATFELSVVVTP